MIPLLNAHWDIKNSWRKFQLSAIKCKMKALLLKCKTALPADCWKLTNRMWLNSCHHSDRFKKENTAAEEMNRKLMKG